MIQMIQKLFMLVQVNPHCRRCPWQWLVEIKDGGDLWNKVMGGDTETSYVSEYNVVEIVSKFK